MGDKSQKDKNKARKQKAAKVAAIEKKKRDGQETGRHDSSKTEVRSVP